MIDLVFDENINTILGKLERLDNPEHDHQERKSLEIQIGELLNRASELQQLLSRMESGEAARVEREALKLALFRARFCSGYYLNMLPDDEIDRYIVLCSFFAGSFTVGTLQEFLWPVYTTKDKVLASNGRGLVVINTGNTAARENTGSIVKYSDPENQFIIDSIPFSSLKFRNGVSIKTAVYALDTFRSLHASYSERATNTVCVNDFTPLVTIEDENIISLNLDGINIRLSKEMFALSLLMLDSSFGVEVYYSADHDAVVFKQGKVWIGLMPV